MNYCLFLGTAIRPYARATGQVGMSRLTTIKVSLTAEDLTQTLQLADAEGEPLHTYYCLPLDPNPSPFDCYLVRVDDVVAC